MMDKNTFNRPPSGYPMADFQQNVSDILLQLSLELGSLDVANDTLFRMFELAIPKATEQEMIAFVKVQGAFRCINNLAKKEDETFKYMIDEHLEYYEN